MYDDQSNTPSHALSCNKYFVLYRRDFLRLGSPLYSQSLEAPNETNQNATELNEDTIAEENEDQEGQRQELPNSDPFDNELIDESFRKTSEVTPRKVSDVISRRLSDTTPDARGNALTFRDVMLSMIVPSSDSGSDVESNSDEDEYMIVPKDTPEKAVSDSSPSIASDIDEDTPPEPPPRRHKTTSRKHLFDHPIDSDSIHNLSPSKQEYKVAMETSDQQQNLVTAEVDGVDIDTIGNDQVVSSIDQGEDMVILDVKGEELIADRKLSGASSEVSSDIDKNLPNTDAVGSAIGTPSTKPVGSPRGTPRTEPVANATGMPSREPISSTTGTPSAEPIGTTTGTPITDPVGSTTGTPSTETAGGAVGSETDFSATETAPVAADVSYDDISMRLSLQLSEPSLDSSGGSSLNQQTETLNEEDENAEEIEKDEDEEDEEELKPCHLIGGDAVPLTRVKCVVSMTTPRDARAHGATDCPSFVEFDMSVDGFGCLFLPAIAPQVSAGKGHVHK